MKRNNKKGFTLIELLVTILILVILIVAMDTGMSTALRVYKESIFFSNSSSLEFIINTSLENVMRYSEDIFVRNGEGNFVQGSRVIEGGTIPAEVQVLFTSEEYGAQYAYIHITNDDEGAPIRIRSFFSGASRDLINSGAFLRLKVSDMTMEYNDGVYEVTYLITSTEDASMTRPVHTWVRILNQ